MRQLILFALFLLASPLHAQFQGTGTAFEIDTTLSTPFPANWFDTNDVAGSADLITDLRNANGGLGHFGPFPNMNSYHSRYCVGTNADPEITITIASFFYNGQYTGTCPTSVFTGCLNNVVHIPTSCTSPPFEGHMVFINTDQPEWLWDFYNLYETSEGVWVWSGEGKRWARTAAAAASTPYDWDGLGQGMVYQYTSGTGATQACHPIAARPLMAISRAAFNANPSGSATHALMAIFDGESAIPHAKRWPCLVDFSSTNERTDADRVNAPHIGERLMLSPSFDCNGTASGLVAGPWVRYVCRTAQTYGILLADTGGENEFTIEVDGPASNWAGVDMSCTSGCMDLLLQNMRWVDHPLAWAGEDEGDPPPGTPDAPVITTTSLPAGQEGDPYSQNICVVNGSGTAPYAWMVTVGSLPTGISLGSPSGNCVPVSGTPTVPGTSNFTVEVEDDAMLTDTQALSILIDSAEPPDPPDEDEPIVTGGVTWLWPFNFPLTGLQNSVWPTTIESEWGRDVNLVPNATTTYLEWRCAANRWHLIDTIDIQENGGTCDMPGCVGEYSFDLAALKIPACRTLQFRIRAPADNVNYGAESPRFDVQGNYVK